MNYILDIALIVVVAVAAIYGYKKGFVKSLASMLSNIIALIGAKILSVKFAPVVFSNWFEQSLTETINQKIATFGDSASAQVNGALNSVPDSLSGFLSIMGIDKAAMSQSVSDSIAQGGVTVTESLMANVVSPVMTWIIRIILFAICFALIVFVLKLVVLILDKVTDLPVIKQANGILGLAFGLIEGIIGVIIVCVILQLVAGLIGSGPVTEFVADSKIVTFVSSFVGNIKFNA